MTHDPSLVKTDDVLSVIELENLFSIEEEDELDGVELTHDGAWIREPDNNGAFVFRFWKYDNID